MNRRQVLTLLAALPSLALTRCTRKEGAPLELVKGQRNRLRTLRSGPDFSPADSKARLTALSQMLKGARQPDGSYVLSPGRISQFNAELNVVLNRAIHVRRTLEELRDELEPYVNQGTKVGGTKP